MKEVFCESLAERLKKRIRHEGELSFREWMNAALYDSHSGYYCQADRTRWGRSGDYRTSPERSRLFAATFADYFARLSDELGSPKTFTILEYGAGDGTFARGVLSTLQQQRADVYAATKYLCVEMSHSAMMLCASALEPFRDRVELLTSNQPVDQIEAGVIFSNELIDAFPVHRVGVRQGHLRELFVGLDSQNDFIWVEREPGTPRLAEYFARYHVQLAEGQTAEVNLEAAGWLQQMAVTLNRGFLVTVDYGASAAELYQTPERFDGTLRAFSHHRLSLDILSDPGERDLTASINWTDLIETGRERGWQTIEFRRQDEFLLRAGLLQQLERLSAEILSEAQVMALRLGAREMILPEGLSAGFQVLVQSKVNG